jgi:hypothetical protein
MNFDFVNCGLPISTPPALLIDAECDSSCYGGSSSRASDMMKRRKAKQIRESLSFHNVEQSCSVQALPHVSIQLYIDSKQTQGRKVEASGTNDASALLTKLDKWLAHVVAMMRERRPRHQGVRE